MFEKYADFSVEDFVKEEDFIQWVKFSDSHENTFWTDFIRQYPRQQETVDQAYQIVLQLSEASRHSMRHSIRKQDAAEIWMEVETAIAKNNEEEVFFSPNWKKWMAAASIIFAIGAFIYINGLKQKQSSGVYAGLIENATSPLEEIINTSEKPLKIFLPDKSFVVLEKNSRLSYVKGFKGSEREVFLSGAAFFNVTKNPKKPFLVYANELVTKVLGTSFNIKAFENDKHVTVSVKTGKVSVFANKYNTVKNPVSKGIVLIPNQQAAFFREKETLQRSLVSQPRVVVSEEELRQLTFTNAPVSNIFEAMERAYGVAILFDGELMSGCRLTTSLSNETLFERLDIVCEALEATYKVVDAQVIISGKKCN